MKRKINLFLSLTIAICFLLYGTSFADDKINIYVATWESDAMNAKLQQLCDEHFADTNIKVNFLAGNFSDYSRQITAMIRANDNLDVFEAGYGTGYNLFVQDMVLDLTDALNTDENQQWLEGFYTGSMDGWQSQENRIYGLPGLSNVYGVYYNATWLTEHNLPLPNNNWKWEDLWNLATRIHQAAPELYGLYNFDTSIFGVAQMSVSEGGANFVSSPVNTDRVTVDSTLSASAAKVSELIQAGVLPRRTYEGDSLCSQFEAGSIPLLWYGQWEANRLIQQSVNFEWGFAAAPSGSVTRATAYDSTGFCISKNSPHPALALEVAKFLSTDCIGAAIAETPIAATAYESSAEDYYNALIAAGHPEAADSFLGLNNYNHH